MTAKNAPQDGSSTPVQVTQDEVKVDLPQQPEQTTVKVEPAHPDEDQADDTPESPSAS